MDKNNSSLIWEIVSTFFISKRIYQAQYRNYERMVRAFAREFETPREKLKLSSEEVAALLDFKEIEHLRNVHLRKLKDLSHQMFRTDEATDLFDKYVSDIYHEISILKEEHYMVSTYAPLYEEEHQLDLTERDKILNEVHEFFPQKTRDIHKLFQKAQRRLDRIIPEYGRERVFVRSLYLFGDELLKGVYRGGLEGFYRKIYGQYGAAKGYIIAARSFYESGFYEQAQNALKKARAALKEDPRLADDIRKELKEEIKRLDKQTQAALVR